MHQKNTHSSVQKGMVGLYNTATLRTAKRAHRLIELMLKEMQLGLRNPEYRMTDQWDRLFGPKQSMVANMQKLVAALMSLPHEKIAAAPMEMRAQEAPALTEEEMKLLTIWLSETKTQAE